MLEVLPSFNLAGKGLCLRLVSDRFMEHLEKVRQVLLIDDGRHEELGIEIDHLLLLSRSVAFLEVGDERFDVEGVLALRLDGVMEVHEDLFVELEEHFPDSVALFICEDGLQIVHVMGLHFALPLIQYVGQSLLGARCEGRRELHERRDLRLILDVEVVLPERVSSEGQLVEPAELVGDSQWSMLIVFTDAPVLASAV